MEGVVTASQAYDHLYGQKYGFPESWWATFIWNWHIPQRIRCLLWLLINDKILTWDNLCKRGWVGPGFYPLCKVELESIHHLFVTCSFTRQKWVIFFKHPTTSILPAFACKKFASLVQLFMRNF